jgi:hypothetical protein
VGELFFKICQPNLVPSTTDSATKENDTGLVEHPAETTVGSTGTTFAADFCPPSDALANDRSHRLELEGESVSSSIVPSTHKSTLSVSDSGYGGSNESIRDARNSIDAPLAPSNLSLLEASSKSTSQKLPYKEDADVKTNDSGIPESTFPFFEDDLRSIISDRDDINSQASTRRSPQQILAETHLAALLAHHEVLQPLFREALNLVDEYRFIKNLRSLLKQFYMDLTLQGKTNLEKVTIQLLLSRWSRVRLAQQVLDHLQPKTQEPVDEQVPETKLQIRDLEDWIANNAGLSSTMDPTVPHTTHDVVDDTISEEKEDFSDDSDDEDFEKLSDLPNVAEMESFILRGKPFSKISATLCLFPLPNSLSSLTRILMSMPRDRVWFSDEEDTSLLNKMKTTIEDATENNWDWWPLRPKMKQLQKDQTRVHWHCVRYL